MYTNYIVIIVLCYRCVISVFATGPPKPPANHITIGCFEVPPLLTSKMGPDGNRTFQGVVPNIMDYAFNSHQNLSYTIVPTDIKQIAKYGLDEAAFIQAASNEVDLVITGHVPTNERLKRADVTYPYLYMKYRLLQPYPKEKSRLLAAVKPFQPMVWLSIVAALAVVVVFLTGFSCYEQRTKADAEHRTVLELLGINCIYVITVLLGQGNVVSSPKIFVRLVAASWCLMVIVLSNSFSGQMTSFLTKPIFETMVNSFEELADSTDLHLNIEANSIMAQTFLNAKSGTFKKLGDSLRAHPENMPKTRAQFDERIESFQVVYPGIDVITTTIVNQHWTKNGSQQCGLTLSEPVSFFQYLVGVLPKNSPWPPFVNRRIFMMLESGLLDHFTDAGVVDVSKCLVKNVVTTRKAPLKLKDLPFAFIVLGIGSALALLVFIGENIIRLRNKRLAIIHKQAVINYKVVVIVPKPETN